MSTPNLRFFSFSLFFLADMNDHHLTFELADLQFDTIVTRARALSKRAAAQLPSMRYSVRIKTNEAQFLAIDTRARPIHANVPTK